MQRLAYDLSADSTTVAAIFTWVPPITVAAVVTRMFPGPPPLIPAPLPEPGWSGIRVEGRPEADTLFGTTRDDWLYGRGGDDVFMPSAGMDLLIGGAGHDVVVTGLMRDEARVDFEFHRISGPTGDNTFDEVEVLDFGDGDWVLDAAAPAARVDALYRAVLQRPADPTGLVAWSAALEAGMSLVELGERIFRSDEYLARFGAPDRAAVKRVAEAPAVLDAPIWVPDAEMVLVARLYHLALRRAPDREGLSFWTGLMERGASLAEVAGGVLGSVEGRAKAPGYPDGAALAAAAEGLPAILALADVTYAGVTFTETAPLAAWML